MDLGRGWKLRQPTPRPRPPHHFDHSPLSLPRHQLLVSTRLSGRVLLCNDPPTDYDHTVTTPTTSPAPTPVPAFTPHQQERWESPQSSYAVRHDLFPAEVAFTGPGGLSVMTLPKCRVLIGVDSVYVFIDGPRGPVIAFYDELPADPADAYTGDLMTGFTVLPSHPEQTGVITFTVRPTNACGCGSRLRGFRPFGRLSYVPSPG